MAKTKFLIVGILFSVLSLLPTARSVNCSEDEMDEEWRLYNDEHCLKTIDGDFLTYDEAEARCKEEGGSAPSLPLLKDAQYSQFVFNYTYNGTNMYDNIWIGGQYNNETKKFEWSDGEAFSFTNWANGYPRPNPNGDEKCTQLQSPYAFLYKVKSSMPSNGGLWYDTVCGRRNRVVCQKNADWSMEEVVNELIKLRKAVAVLQNKLK